MTPGDPYSRLDYRRLVAWPERMAREEPFLRQALEGAPVPRLLDLGCGTGEHARLLLSLGFDVTGVDASEAQLAAALEAGEEPGLRFVKGDLAALGDAVSGEFGGAVCLGNTLPHLADEAAAGRFLAALAGLLLPGAPFLLQIVNYDRVHSRGERALPLSFRPDGDATAVFLRLMEPRPDGTVVFCPTTLRFRPGAEAPVELLATRSVLLRGWRRSEVEALLDGAGFAAREVFGGMRGEPWSPDASDLVVLARR
ncbi:class I SAM-dependent methyltransferase [Acidobacteria bacterium ACD]|nr:MAG: class I SAM-dependent methyltransferase [Acidobacteriota bacterium]MCE7958413.1 class I SAM-dependent methyltransferase [Acidobacteria bacterium ACB2]MDL1948485.1 class I SAM-dependent methyltransferase [Acidobacteria bacterium ACD]